MNKSIFQSRRFRWGLLSFLALVVMFAFNGHIAKAAIKATAPFYTWDRTDGSFKNSNVDLWLDPNWWVPMIHELGDDNDLYPDACGTGTSTKWAGELTMGLGYTDTTGGDGFQASRNWTLVHCDRDGDGDFDNSDLSVPVNPNAPIYGFIEWSGVSSNTFQTLTNDDISACSNQTCATELITTMFINMDSDCDGDLSDENIPAGGLCFYAEAQPPASTPPYWQGNLQARISAGGGDKTVNHSVAGPNAVSMVNLSANASSPDLHWIVGLGILVMMACGSLFWWSRRQKVVVK